MNAGSIDVRFSTWLDGYTLIKFPTMFRAFAVYVQTI